MNSGSPKIIYFDGTIIRFELSNVDSDKVKGFPNLVELRRGSEYVIRAERMHFQIGGPNTVKLTGPVETCKRYMSKFNSQPAGIV